MIINQKLKSDSLIKRGKAEKLIQSDQMSDRDSGTEAVVSVEDVGAAIGQGSADKLYG